MVYFRDPAKNTHCVWQQQLVVHSDAPIPVQPHMPTTIYQGKQESDVFCAEIMTTHWVLHCLWLQPSLLPRILLILAIWIFKLLEVVFAIRFNSEDITIYQGLVLDSVHIKPC